MLGYRTEAGHSIRSVVARAIVIARWIGYSLPPVRLCESLRRAAQTGVCRFLAVSPNSLTAMRRAFLSVQLRVRRPRSFPAQISATDLHQYLDRRLRRGVCVCE